MREGGTHIERTEAHEQLQQAYDRLRKHLSPEARQHLQAALHSLAPGHRKTAPNLRKPAKSTEKENTRQQKSYSELSQDNRECFRPAKDVTAVAMVIAYDGCLAKDETGILREALMRLKQDVFELQIFNGSVRQNSNLDETLAQSNENGSYRDHLLLLSVATGVTLNMGSLADVYCSKYMTFTQSIHNAPGPAPAGHCFSSDMRTVLTTYYGDDSPLMIPFDRHKLAQVFMHAHNFASQQNSHEVIQINIVEDDREVINALHSFYSDHPSLLPSTVRLRFIHFNPDTDGTPRKVIKQDIQGTGKVRKDYAKIMHTLAKNLTTNTVYAQRMNAHRQLQDVYLRLREYLSPEAQRHLQDALDSPVPDLWESIDIEKEIAEIEQTIDKEKQSHSNPRFDPTTGLYIPGQRPFLDCRVMETMRVDQGFSHPTPNVRTMLPQGPSSLNIPVEILQARFSMLSRFYDITHLAFDIKRWNSGMQSLLKKSRNVHIPKCRWHGDALQKMPCNDENFAATVIRLEEYIVKLLGVFSKYQQLPTPNKKRIEQFSPIYQAIVDAYHKITNVISDGQTENGLEQCFMTLKNAVNEIRTVIEKDHRKGNLLTNRFFQITKSRMAELIRAVQNDFELPTSNNAEGGKGYTRIQ